MGTIRKKCRSCGFIRDHSVRPGGTASTWCKECQRAYSRQHYRDNKEKHNKRRYEAHRRSREAIRLLIREIKQGPCLDCGVSYPYYVMQLDHRPGAKKMFNISDSVSRVRSKEMILKEIAKCDLVCANCHAERTHSRRE